MDALPLAWLTARTFHPDEANQAFTTGRLLETGHYVYNPTDHHGPVLYYAAAALQKAGGANDTAHLSPALLRATPLLFAVLTLVSLYRAVLRLTRSQTAAGLCGTLVATTPFFVFFATDFIQEMLLTAFLAGLFAALVAFNTSESPKRGRHLFLAGLFAGLALATKETAVLSFAAALPAAWIAWRPKAAKIRQMPSTRLAVPILVMLLTAGLFFSSFGTHPEGLTGFLAKAPLSYLLRAQGAGAADTLAAAHVHPWWWHARRLLLPEAGWSFSLALPVLFVLGGLPFYAKRNRPFLFFALYALLLFACYSAIPYKTPWCMLQVVVPLLAACGLAIHQLVSDLKTHTNGVRLAGGLLPIFLLVQALVADATLLREPDRPDLPCQYAAASPQVRELAQDLIRAVGETSSGPRERAAFAAVLLPAEDTWPLPFYLRAAKNVGYWHEPEADLKQIAALPPERRPKALVAPAGIGHLVFPLFPEFKTTRRYEIRPGVRVRLFH